MIHPVLRALENENTIVSLRSLKSELDDAGYEVTEQSGIILTAMPQPVLDLARPEYSMLLDNFPITELIKTVGSADIAEAIHETFFGDFEEGEEQDILFNVAGVYRPATQEFKDESHFCMIDWVWNYDKWIKANVRSNSNKDWLSIYDAFPLLGNKVAFVYDF